MPDLLFLLNSSLLGVGLAMDAFSVSVANGLRQPHMKLSQLCTIAGVFALYQFFMPLAGWFCVCWAAQQFQHFAGLIPWIALVLLAGIGVNMIMERGESAEDAGPGVLWVQGLATSIDALSVGFTLEPYPLLHAILAAGIIGCVTFLLCFLGILMGKKAGSHLADRAGILGGVILILIGLEIFLKSQFVIKIVAHAPFF